MKTFIFLLSSFVVFSSAYAAKGNIWCESGKRLYNALSEEGHQECGGALMQGDACFSGSRAVVIALINDGKINWDEEWLTDAHYMGKDSISYVWKDGPNQVQEKLTLKRCSPSFFEQFK